MATSKSKKVVKEPKLTIAESKLRKRAKYTSFRLNKRIKHPDKPIISWWALFKKSLALLSVNKKQILIFVIVYGLLSLILVRGFSSQIDSDVITESLETVVGEGVTSLDTAFASFGVLVTGTGQVSGETAQLYQTFLIVVSSLAIIWLFRQQQAGNNVTTKLAFYRGMYPLVPFILVLLVAGLQLIPALLGNFLFSTVMSSGLAAGGLEQFLWGCFFFLTAVLSFYMISSSLIALYIVTLPEMTPMRALRQARELVRYRRFSVIRKILALVIICILVLVIVVLPIIFFSPLVAEWVFYLLTIVSIPFINAYMFSLYRELL